MTAHMICLSYLAVVPVHAKFIKREIFSATLEPIHVDECFQKHVL